MWEPIRNIYMTLIAKWKFSTNSEDPNDKKFVFLPKAVEMS